MGREVVKESGTKVRCEKQRDYRKERLNRMADILLPVTCAYPTSFDSLEGIAICCGVALIIEAILLFWKKFPVQPIYRWLLIGAAVIVGVWSFILAYIASQNVLECAGIPNASNSLIQSAEESYNMLIIVQRITNLTLTATIILVVIGIFAFLPRSSSNL